jgi:hypothetical protein
MPSATVNQASTYHPQTRLLYTFKTQMFPGITWVGLCHTAHRSKLSGVHSLSASTCIWKGYESLVEGSFQGNRAVIQGCNHSNPCINIYPGLDQNKPHPLQEKVKQLLAVDMQQAPIKPQCKLRSLCWCNLVVQPWDFKGVDQNKVQQKCEFDPSSVQSMVWALACQLTPVAWLFLVVHLALSIFPKVLWSGMHRRVSLRLAVELVPPGIWVWVVNRFLNSWCLGLNNHL